MAHGYHAARLEKDFPGWDVGQSQVGWYATRKHVLTGADMTAGLLHTVAADTRRGLRAALEAQAVVEERVNEAKRAAGPADFGSAYL